MNRVRLTCLAAFVTVGIAHLTSQAQTPLAALEQSQPLQMTQPAERATPTAQVTATSAPDVVRPAHAVSAVLISDARTVPSPISSKEPIAEPPALVIFLAGLVVIVFVATRRRRDDS